MGPLSLNNTQSQDDDSQFLTPLKRSSSHSLLQCVDLLLEFNFFFCKVFLQSTFEYQSNNDSTSNLSVPKCLGPMKSGQNLCMNTGTPTLRPSLSNLFTTNVGKDSSWFQARNFLGKSDAAQVRSQWVIFKEVIFQEKEKTLSNEQTYTSLLQDYSTLLKDATLPCSKYLSFICLWLCLSSVWGECGFCLMNNIKIKSRNRMNTSTLDDKMMICSNGPPVSGENTNDIDVILDPVCLYTFFYVQI